MKILRSAGLWLLTILFWVALLPFYLGVLIWQLVTRKRIRMDF